MHWIFLGIVAIAITFTYLGALSAWVTVLALTLRIVLLASGLLALYFIWQHIFGRKP